MSARVISLCSGCDLEITLKIDTTFWTPELARECNAFWDTGDEVLEAADGDPVVAIAMRLASHAVLREIDGYKREFLLDFDEEGEGWPTGAPGFPGATVVEIDCPDIAPGAFEVVEDSGGAA